MAVNPNHTSRSRDAALRRLSRANRWVIAGSATLTGVLTAVAASAFPGKTLQGTHASAARAAGATGSDRRLGRHDRHSTTPGAVAGAADGHRLGLERILLLRRILRAGLGHAGHGLRGERSELRHGRSGVVGW